MAKQDKESGLTHQLEAIKGSVVDLMRSKFGLLKERVVLQTKGVKEFTPGLKEHDDLPFRYTVESVLHSQLSNKGTFVLLNLATQHAAAVLDIFYRHGFDMNFLYFPAGRSVHTPFSEAGHGPLSSGRVMEVFTDPEHRERVVQSKNALKRDALNGVAINIHSHASDQEKKHLLTMLPTKDELKRLDISRVLYLLETTPRAGVDTELILYGNLAPEEKHLALAAENLTPLQQYLKNLITSGFSLAARGLDIRHDNSYVRFGRASAARRIRIIEPRSKK